MPLRSPSAASIAAALALLITSCSKENDVDNTTNIYGAGHGGEAGSGGQGDASPGSGGANAGTGGSNAGAAGSQAGSAGSQAGAGGSSDGGPAGSAGSGSDASIDVAVGTCPSLEGPELVPLPLGYCIDSTEVTRAQYEKWLSTGPFSADLPAECAAKKDAGSPHAPGCPMPAAGDLGNLPIACVDWCDAYAYCANNGKHLCGAIQGGANPYEQPSAQSSEWYMACSSGHQRLYPYGNDFEPATCNGYEAKSPGCTGMGCVQPVQSMPGCQSNLPGYAGVFDLSGNVWEWENSCDNSSGNCRMRGGAFGTALKDELACAEDGMNLRGARLELIGFRCCAKSL